MTANDIRQGFLDYFARQDHRVVPSSPLVPGDDPTLLFTNAGMNQFKDVFLGRERRDYRRATTVQKCMRVSGKHNDLDNVGPSLRHHTFFEMLGNFSFGDYFKADAIRFAWELLTDVWKLAPDRLFPTVFKGDAGIPRDVEAFEIWTSFVPPGRVTELGLAENFWQMGETGPCGRCSEIHYYRGTDVPCDQPVCRGVECSCERYVEVWNNVFMEFNRSDDGSLRPLPAPSIDTGMGLERITAVIQGQLSNYDTDLFTPVLTAIAGRAGLRYTGAAGPLDHPDVSMRVIADHLRAMTFLISDGVLPSNEWRGYVLRKIMRRAMRHGKKLGFNEPFLHALVDVVAGEMRGAYPELDRERHAVVRTVRAEEERFDAVLTNGLPRLEELLDRTAASGAAAVPGDAVFRLYDSLGVPLDFAEDLAGQRGLVIDRPGYDTAMEAQRERARAGSMFEAKRGAAFEYTDDAARARLEATADRFEGYATTDVPSAEILALFDEARRQVDHLDAGVIGHVVLDRTPFYVESGGQVSDTGQLLTADGPAADVVAMTRLSPAGARVHRVRTMTTLRLGQRVTAAVNADARNATRRNHTATHLLQAALRRQLGAHVRQAGSLVAPDRLRFDFSHPEALTDAERRAIEHAVNEAVYTNTPVTTEVRNTEDAIRAGATALFGEKYGDRVRVVTVGDFSQELCGGTHVSATGDIGPFVITEESGVAAGVRRIEALTGAGAVRHLQARDTTLARTQSVLNVPAEEMPDAVARLQSELKRLQRENAQLKMKLAVGGPASVTDDTLTIGDVTLVTRRVSGLDKDALRGLSDSLRDRLDQGIVVLAADNDGKAQIVVAVTKNLTARVKAGQLVRDLAPIIGGGGGGRPDFAEAGGKDTARLDDVLVKAREVVAALLR